ncbi:MAG: hypothetical protein JSS93_10950 [Bacteroidetes bacterium]|nr:hypothetical protein [Bacteroidota bacterium]
MKTTLTIIFFLSINLTSFSQFRQSNVQAVESPKINHVTTPSAVTYRLFPTQNMWTFIKLNTRNGQMWQVQFDVQGDNRHEVYLNLISLVTLDNESNDRFTLYPTQNMYNFILLDQQDGKVWQVQWSTETKNRIIVPIE